MFNSEIERSTRVNLIWQNHVEIGDAWRYDRMRSTYWRLYIHNRDGAELRFGPNRYPLPAGRVHLIPAWLTFDYRTARRVKQYAAHFELTRWTARVTQRFAPRPIALPLDPGMRSTCSEVKARHEAGHGQSPATLMRAQSLVHAALAAWMDELGEDAVQRALRAVADQQEIEPALGYIDRHLGEPIRNEDLAERCHYSTDHFAKVFREVVGQTPGRYVTERRLAAAAQALVFTNRSIDDIAASLGFANRFYFSRAFKRQLGTPPAAYRANQREG